MPIAVTDRDLLDDEVLIEALRAYNSRPLLPGAFLNLVLSLGPSKSKD